MDMNFDQFISKFNSRLTLIIVIYLIIGLFLLNYYQYILNSDGISYISIAQKYMVLDFKNAINGYWGPLFSWLMIPFLIFSSTPSSNLYLVKLLSLFVGIFTIIGVKTLSDKFEIRDSIQTVLLMALIPIMLSFSLFMITPDLLVVCFLIFYLSYLFSSNYSYNIKNGVLCGLFGALAFLTKSYAFLFFVFHFAIMNLFYYYEAISKENKKIILKNSLIGLSIFFIISGVWIGLISEKYGYLNIGTSGKYNYELVGPQSQGQAMFYQGLIEPPNDSALSAWEDPSYFNMQPWSAFGSVDNFQYQLNLIGSNIVKIADILEMYSILSLIILMGAILFILKAPSKSSRNKMIYLMVTILIFSGGYSFILIEFRYLWLVFILLMIMGIYLINNIYEIGKLGKLRRNILLMLIIISFVVGPVSVLVNDVNLERDIYDLSQTLYNDYHVYGNIASDENWELTIYLAYYLKSKYYGITTNNYDENAINNQLEVNRIKYYFVWNKTVNLQLEGYREITHGKISILRIYERTG